MGKVISVVDLLHFADRHYSTIYYYRANNNIIIIIVIIIQVGQINHDDNPDDHDNPEVSSSDLIFIFA